LRYYFTDTFFTCLRPVTHAGSSEKEFQPDLADDSALRQVLHDYFAWATTTTMARYHRSADDVPDGLTIPRWSWDGLQE
jgi:hemoglobin